MKSAREEILEYLEKGAGKQHHIKTKSGITARYRGKNKDGSHHYTVHWPSGEHTHAHYLPEHDDFDHSMEVAPGSGVDYGGSGIKSSKFHSKVNSKNLGEIHDAMRAHSKKKLKKSNDIDKLLELEEKLIKAKEELEKQMGMMDPTSGMPGGTAASGGVNTAMGKKEHCGDEEEDKKMIEEKLDEHNENKHGEPKDEDSAMKAEMIKFDANGQWSLDKSQRPVSSPGAPHLGGDDRGKISKPTISRPPSDKVIKPTHGDLKGAHPEIKKQEGNIKYPSAKDLEYPDSPAIRAAEAKEKEMQVQMPERKVFKADEDEDYIRAEKEKKAKEAAKEKAKQKEKQLRESMFGAEPERVQGKIDTSTTSKKRVREEIAEQRANPMHGKVKTFKPGDPGFDERAKAAKLVKFDANGQWSLDGDN